MPDINANDIGEVNVGFDVPEGIPEGTHELILIGSAGTVARGLFTSTRDNPDPRRWFSQRLVARYDPMAQTFTLPTSRLVGGVDIKLTVIGTGNVRGMRMQIREVENGIPTQVCIGESVVDKADLLVGNQWTRFIFDPIIPLLANTEYAIVLFSDDSETSVAIARQGEFVSPGNGPVVGWVTSQPYQVGVLLVSSDSSSWTPLQDADLTFRILGCRFNQIEKVIDLGVVNHTNITDAMVKASVDRPFGVADAKFEIIATQSGDVYLDVEDSPKQLSGRISGDFQLRVHLYGDSTSSPILVPGTQLILGNLSDSEISISLPYPAGAIFTSTITFSALRAGNSLVSIYAAQQRVDGGGNPVITDGVYQYDWVQVTEQISVVPLGNGFNDETWQIEGLKGVGLDLVSRVKLVFDGSPNARPVVTNLRVITS